MLKYWRFRFFIALAILAANSSYSWNSLGHRLVAQIAYERLDERAKVLFNQYNRDFDKGYASRSLISAATWLDGLRSRKRKRNIYWLQRLHYIDIPFARDHTTLVQPDRVNAVRAIEQAKLVLKNKQSSTYYKGLNLRILLHVVGDIHQPMHTVNYFSRSLPKGDHGGNLIILAPNPVAKNLHAYWDNGGGLLKGKQAFSPAMLKKQAQTIMNHWPCDEQAKIVNPQVWAKESHSLAVKYAYGIQAGAKPSESYQQMVEQISEQQIALAGCRLAFVLNSLAA